MLEVAVPGHGHEQVRGNQQQDSNQRGGERHIDLDREWEKFLRLITRYALRDTGYTARRAVFADRIEGDYDHLARYGEWQMTDRADPAPVGEEGAE